MASRQGLVYQQHGLRTYCLNTRRRGSANTWNAKHVETESYTWAGNRTLEKGTTVTNYFRNAAQRLYTGT
jgi:hypothetical protein